jgi:hypothetical protein
MSKEITEWALKKSPTPLPNYYFFCIFLKPYLALVRVVLMSKPAVFQILNSEEKLSNFFDKLAVLPFSKDIFLISLK